MKKNKAYLVVGFLLLFLAVFNIGCKEKDIPLHSPSADPKVSSRYFISSFSDVGIDKDGNNFFDSITINAEINVPEKGQYTCVGILRKDSQQIDTVNNQFDFKEGLNGIKFKFDGFLISDSGLNGTFSLDVKVGNDFGVEIIHEEDVYQTSEYSYTQFEGYQADFTKSIEHSGQDIDGDKVYEALKVSLGTIIRIPGKYTIEGYLLDADKSQLSFAKESYNLKVGEQDIELKFDGDDIAFLRKDSPYFLKDLSLYINGQQIVDFHEANLKLDGYSFSQFRKTSDAIQEHVVVNPYDENKNGKYESLVVSIETNIDKSGDYIAVASLYTSDNKRIQTLERTFYLGSGKNTITLNFAGSNIFNTKTDGPYSVQNFMLYNNKGALTLLKNNVVKTSNYSFSLFE